MKQEYQEMSDAFAGLLTALELKDNRIETLNNALKELLDDCLDFGKATLTIEKLKAAKDVLTACDKPSEPKRYYKAEDLIAGKRYIFFSNDNFFDSTDLDNKRFTADYTGNSIIDKILYGKGMNFGEEQYLHGSPTRRWYAEEITI